MGKKLKRSKKAVSPVIAALLLIAISVAAAVVTYSWVMGMIKSTGGSAQTTIRIDEVLFGEALGSSGKGSTLTVAGSTTTVLLVTEEGRTDFSAGDYVRVGTEYSKVVSAVEGHATESDTITVTPALSTAPATGVAVKEVDNGIKVTIRNTGSVPAVIATVYVYKGDTQIVKYDGISYAIQATKLGEIGVKQTGATWTSLLPAMGTIEPASPTGTTVSTTFSNYLVVSAAYVVKIVTDNGFTVEGSFYTPSAFA